MDPRKFLSSLTDAELLLLSPVAEGILRASVVPHPREQEFLDLADEEVLFGGAVGGGKTEALMLWLLEGVQHSNFSGLFLRRTFAQLAGSPTSPIERSWRFFAPAGGVYNAGEKVWRFPNGAMVRFGHMQHENDKHNYDGPEFHRIAFDQVEQFSETQYTYMFSRMRRLKGYPIPCGIRSSANPVGGNWVKHRFVTPEAIAELKKYTAYDQSPPGMVFDCPCGAKFVPSRIADNPSLEVDEYVNRLRGKLGAALAAKLANGDWSAVEGAVIDAEDLRYYHMRGEHIFLNSRSLGKLPRFATCDTAGTSKQKAAEQRGKAPSWSVVGIWEHAPAGLFLRHIWRGLVGWPDLKIQVQRVLKNWGNPQLFVENAHHGQVLAAEIPGAKLLNTRIYGMGKGQVIEGAKYDRAVASGLLQMISDHRLFLPDVSVDGAAGWMPEFEGELLGWTGHPDETADQIDVCSHAAYRLGSKRSQWGGVIDSTKVPSARRW